MPHFAGISMLPFHLQTDVFFQNKHEILQYLQMICIFPFNYFRLDVRKPHVFVYFSPLFTSLSEIHYGNESFCIREPLIPIFHNLFWFFTPAANFFSWRLVWFFKDIFEGRNKKRPTITGKPIAPLDIWHLLIKVGIFINFCNFYSFFN